MSKISAKETEPEINVRSFLFSKGFRFRKNDKRLQGKPDIVLPKYNAIIFIHGCFWHGHNCKSGKLPETRREFWENKINQTKERDKRNILGLEGEGWKVIVVWQCELKNKKNREERLKILMKEIISDKG